MPPRPASPATLLLPLALLLSGCGACEPEPVLTALPDQEGAAPEVELPSGEVVRAGPEPEDGLLLDAHAVAGKPWPQVRDRVLEALGPVQGMADRPDGTREVVLERGRVRTDGGIVVRITVRLPRPMRRSEVLSALGISPAVRRWHVFTREFRARHHAGFDTIILRRAGRGAEEVVEAILVLRPSRG